MNLETCEFEDVKDNYVITAERMEQLVLEYVQVGNEINPEGYVVEDYLFNENYLIGDIFFTEDTLYTILWDCRICTDSYLILKDAPENRATLTSLLYLFMNSRKLREVIMTIVR